MLILLRLPSPPEKPVSGLENGLHGASPFRLILPFSKILLVSTNAGEFDWPEFNQARLFYSRPDMHRAIARRTPFSQLTPTSGAVPNSRSSSCPLHSVSRHAGLPSRVVGTSRLRAVRLWIPILSIERPTRLRGLSVLDARRWPRVHARL